MSKRPSLGPLEKSSKKKRRLDPSVKVLLTQIAIGVGLFSILGLTLTGVWYLTRVPSLNIDSVRAAGGETISAEEVTTKAEAVLNGSYGRVIPKRFFAFYPQGEILSAVSTVDRIKDVVVERVSLHELEITYGEYMPFALWCSDGPADVCLFIDERGHAFAPAPQLTGGNFVRYRSSVVAPEIGKDILSFESFWRTVTFIKLLEVDGYYVQAVEVDSVNDVYYELVGGSELRASLSQEPQALYDNLHTILNSEEFSHLKPDNFQYIDLRFGNKVYINEELESSASTSTATTTDAIAKGEDVTVKSELVESEEVERRGDTETVNATNDSSAAPVTIQFAN